MYMKKFSKLVFLILFTQVLISTFVYISGKNAMVTEQIRFYPSDPNDWTSEDTNFNLNGKIYYPDGYSSDIKYSTALLFHGKHRTLKDNDYFANSLASRGIMVISIDFRGHGESEGEFPFDDG